MATYGSGNILSTQTGPNTFTVTQAETASNLPPAWHLAALGSDKEKQQPIDFGFGPISIVGYADFANYGVGLEVILFGISLGTFYGNLKEGLGVAINVIAAKGLVKLYLKDGAVWLKIELTPMWGGGIDIDQKLFDFSEEELQKARAGQGLKH